MENTFPASIFCIIATEFCERFSFCGLRTILSLYLRNELGVPENTATILYHIFIMLCYFVPVVGAVTADSFLGRYRTILYFSIVYLFGNILMCLQAIPPMHLEPLTFTIIGLILISIGTGGIKPCVAAFGGDQFSLPDQEDRLQGFFSMFYFAINTGGLLGMLLTPTLRKSIHCFGGDSCYALGFGFPAALMLVALYYSEGHCETKLIEDMKIMYAIMYLYLPLPIFWSLFDQQGSRWTFQASRTNGNIHLFGYKFQILPDQMQVINPALVLILIPIFERIIYPSCILLNTPLNRMSAGGFAAGVAFLASGILELQLQEASLEIPEKIGTATINIINTLNCQVKIQCPRTEIIPFTPLGKHDMLFHNLTVQNHTKYFCEVTAPIQCDSRVLSNRLDRFEAYIDELQMNTVLIGLKNENSVGLFPLDSVNSAKALSGNPKIRVVLLHNTPIFSSIIVSLLHSENSTSMNYDLRLQKSTNELSLSQYQEILSGDYKYHLQFGKQSANDIIRLEMGAVYILVLREYNNIIEFKRLFTISEPHKVHMLWLLPQYVLISIGEIMFAISGLEFSFTQAPKSMKTIIIAAWYLSVAFGNFFVILITQAKIFKTQANEFFMFAVLIFIDMVIFWLMCSKYTPVPLEPDGSSYTRKESQPLLAMKEIQSTENQ